MIEHTFFVWPAFAITFLILGLQLWVVLKQSRRTRQKLRSHYHRIKL